MFLYSVHAQGVKVRTTLVSVIDAFATANRTKAIRTNVVMTKVTQPLGSALA
jgi:hypothetical protein